MTGTLWAGRCYCPKNTMHRFQCQQTLPNNLDEAWDFFSSPANLLLMTPPELNLVPITEIPQEMYEGMFVTYRVKPIAGIPMTWVTEITHIKHHQYFIDEQRLGPYRIWHHQHHFKEVPGGVEMTDILDYRIPLGPVGILLQKIMIGKKVEQIFEYRRQRLTELFGA